MKHTFYLIESNKNYHKIEIYLLTISLSDLESASGINTGAVWTVTTFTEMLSNCHLFSLFGLSYPSNLEHQQALESI